MIRVLFAAFLLVLVGACSGEDARDAAFQEKVARTRTAMSNGCSTDADCQVTGCHHNICRATPEPDYCDQRMVVALDSGDDVATLRRLVSNLLTVREAESVRIGGYSAGHWTVSFSAEMSQRASVETMLNAVSLSGFARLHPDSASLSRGLWERLADPDSALRTLRGAGPLVEKQIRAGDVLSKDDIHHAWTQVADRVATDNPEVFWAYDVIAGKIPYLRLWPVDTRRRISVRQWENVDVRTDNGDVILTGTVSDEAAPTLDAWTRDGDVIVLTLGQEVIASVLPARPVEDGRFEVVVHNAAQDELVLTSFQMLRAVADMSGTVRLDADLTKKVERDIDCQTRFPRTCACVAGSCGWRDEADYNACLYNLGGNE